MIGHESRSVAEAGLHVRARECGVLCQHVFDGIAGAEKFEDGLHGDARATNDGTAIANSGIKRDAVGHAEKVGRAGGKPRGKLPGLGGRWAEAVGAEERDESQLGGGVALRADGRGLFAVACF